MKSIAGGICAPKGFEANGVHVGFKKGDKKDLALIYCKEGAHVAGTFTKNLFKAAPLKVTQEHMKVSKTKAILVNSGVSNSCTVNGMERAKESCDIAAKALGIKPEEVLVGSTGTIGVELDTGLIKDGMDELVSGLGDHSDKAAQGIMTSDTFKKERSISFVIDGVECRMGIIAKGSGMIEPNMATMLAFVTTDVVIAPELLQKAISESVDESFNMINVDRCNSTNDMVLIATSSQAGNAEISEEDENYNLFATCLGLLTRETAKDIARDGNGATKLIEARVAGVKSREDARILAKSIISSNLVKASLRFADAYWGRIFAAMGQTGVTLDPEKIDCAYETFEGTLTIYSQGKGIPFSEEEAEKILSVDPITIAVNCHEGEHEATAWGCDLTPEYAELNGSYRKH